MLNLNNHSSPETAYVVEDYPYGFKLRCKIRYWLEKKPGKGFRFCSQTTNPKLSYESWNKPKCSTYVRIAGAMYLDQEEHVAWSGVSEYTSAKDILEFVKRFPNADKEDLFVWVKMKLSYEKTLKDHSNDLSYLEEALTILEASK